jgi:hypothetical protein
MFARSQLDFSAVSILNQFQSFKDLKYILRKVGEAACRYLADNGGVEYRQKSCQIVLKMNVADFSTFYSFCTYSYYIWN